MPVQPHRLSLHQNPKLKELDPAAKLVVSSGYSDASVMSNFREYGFDDVIPKPWRTAEVSEVFRRVLVQNANRRPGNPSS
jgi:DNA-binding NarL/FixJ family response regulator